MATTAGLTLWRARRAGRFATRHIDNHVKVIEALLKPSVITLPAHIQAVYIQNLFKVLTRLAMFVTLGRPCWQPRNLR